MRVTTHRRWLVNAMVLVASIGFVTDFGSLRVVEATSERPSNMDDFYDPAATVNGCGSQGAEGIDVPDSFFGLVSFTEACDRHDRCYGTEGMTREACDDQMLEDTLEACGLIPGCARMAAAYYIGVRVGGREPYEEGQRAARGRNFSRDRRGERNWARAHGDPHVRSLDGRSISFQAAGVFEVARADDEVLVQSRTFPSSDHVSVLTGVAMLVGDRVVSVQIDRDEATVGVYLDGEPVADRVTVLDGGVVTIDVEPETTGSVSIWRPDGIQIDVTTFGRSLDFAFAVPERHPSEFTGLLVDGGGEGATVARVEGSDDWETTSDFDSSIRVSAADSWFTDDHDFDYHAPELERLPLPLPALPSDLVAEATARCLEAGVSSDDLNACVYDVVVGGDAGWAGRSAFGATRVSELSGRVDESVASPVELVVAVGDGDVDAVRRLLADGADPNEPGSPDPSLEGISELLPLAVAVGNGDAPMVEVLLEAGADPNAGVPPGGTTAEFTGSGMTPLDGAALSDDVEIVRLLVAAGARADRGFFAGDGRDLAEIMLSPTVFDLLFG